jgi:hypothetical protein
MKIHLIDSSEGDSTWLEERRSEAVMDELE